MGKAGFPPTCPGVLGLLGSEQQSGGQQSVAVLSLELEEAWGPVVSFAAPVPGGAGGEPTSHSWPFAWLPWLHLPEPLPKEHVLCLLQYVLSHHILGPQLQ